MAENVPNGEFWLPPEFFSDDELPPEKSQHLNRNPNLSFPSDFPANLGSKCYFLSSSGFSSPVESIMGSTETESDEEDEFITGLTRPLTQRDLRANEKHRSWPLSTSPQSPLRSREFRSRRKPSPMRESGSWDLSYAAVVRYGARVKMNGGDEGLLKGQGHFGPLLGPKHEQQISINHNIMLNQNNCCSIPRIPSPCDLLHRQLQLQQYILSQHRTKVLGQVQFEENAKYVRSSLGLNPYASPSPLVQHQINQIRGAYFGGFGSKQACAGTGVFIPRPSPSNAANRSEPIRTKTISAVQVDDLANHGHGLP